VDQIGGQYAFVVIDCEAGLEHLSRRTAGNVDALIILSDPTLRGLDTAARVIEVASSLRTQVGCTVFAFNRVRDGIPESLQQAARDRGLDHPLTIPEDPLVGRLDAEGKPLTGLPADSPALEAVKRLLEQAAVL
jgi:CO dehydrogenase maturation factor